MKSSTYLCPGQFAVIAHRGGALEVPENTVFAFQHAFELYSEIYFELDVRPTRDGEIVVIHDETVDRTTNGHGRIHELTYGEIQNLDAGFSFSKEGKFPFRGKGLSIPLLREVLERFPKTRISIEHKPGHPFFGEKILKILDQTGARQRVVLASEGHSILLQFRRLAPDICVGFSKREMVRNYFLSRYKVPFGYLKTGDVLQVPFEYQGRNLNLTPLIQRSHSLGKAVHVWTVNEETKMKQLISDGADGIITDAPRLLLKVARELKKI